MKQYSYWVHQYGELDRKNKTRRGQKYTPEALRIFPRYNVLAAILTEIERLDPEEDLSFQDMKQLLLAAHTADNLFTRPPYGDIELSAMKEERDNYLSYIGNIEEENTVSVAPLFYRRVLSTNETTAIWRQLQKRWGIEGSVWYPIIAGQPTDLDIIIFQDKYFQEYAHAQVLSYLANSKEIKRCWEIREDNTAFLIETSQIDFVYNGTEGYWCAEDMSWVVYASHESSITVGGAWLIAMIKEAWPRWEDYIWKDPFFQ